MRTTAIAFLLSLLLLASCENGNKRIIGDADTASDGDTLLNDETTDQSDGSDLTVTDADFTATCGDSIVNGGEVCDGEVKNCVDIDPLSYTAGKAKCLDNCTGWDTDTCEEIPHTCGNDIKEGPEFCDGDLKNCIELDAELYGGGKAKCREDCSGYDTATCEAIEPHECGNGIVEGPEACDGGLINCVDIDDQLYSGGKAYCEADCTAWDTETCDAAATAIDWTAGSVRAADYGARSSHVALVHNGYVWVIGGNGNDGLGNDVYYNDVWRTSTMSTWEQVGTAPSPCVPAMPAPCSRTNCGWSAAAIPRTTTPMSGHRPTARSGRSRRSATPLSNRGYRPSSSSSTTNSGASPARATRSR